MLKQLSKGKEILFYYIILLTQGLLELWSEIFLWVVIYFTLTVLKVFKFGVCSGFHLPGFGMNMDIYRRKSKLGHFSGSDSYRIWCFYSTCFPDTGQNPVSFRLISYPLCTKIVIAQTENGILIWIVEKDATVIKVIWLLQNILDNLFLTEKFDDICNWLIFASFGLFWSVSLGRILHKFEEFSHRLLKHVLFLTNIWHVIGKPNCITKNINSLGGKVVLFSGKISSF